jgi:hypothetical protein
VQLAAPGDAELVRVCALLHAQRDVVDQLALEALLELREVTYLPSLPAKGEVLTWKVMLTVGSSTVSGGSASARPGSQSVSEIRRLDAGDADDIAGAALCTSLRSRPR